MLNPINNIILLFLAFCPLAYSADSYTIAKEYYVKTEYKNAVEALQHLEDVSAIITQENIDAYLLLARSHYRLDEYTVTIKLIERLDVIGYFEINSRKKIIRYLSDAYYELGDFQEAIELKTQLVQLIEEHYDENNNDSYRKIQALGRIAESYSILGQYLSLIHI